MPPGGDTEAAAVAALGLFALQHRGQESAGVAVSDGGLAHALAEASRFSGHDFTAEDDAPYGAVIVAAHEAPDWPHLRELGTVA